MAKRAMRTTVIVIVLPNRPAAGRFSPILSTSSGPVDYRLVHERYLRDLGFEPVSVEAREIGGLDGKLPSWETLYRQLEADAQRLLAANDPRLDVEV
jgi:hypothetical protein